MAKEEIPPCFIDENLNQWIEKIMRMEKNTLKQEEEKLLRESRFPNTYAFTKHLAEHGIL